MSLQKYLQIIKEIDPGRIYVENVRTILNTNRFKARLFCEMAVRDNLFVKKIGVVCPNVDCNRIIESFDSYDKIPDKISCEICEELGKEVYTYETKDLTKIEYYQLKQK